ncbi:hypothetical protein ACOSQ3_005123 [Xanthoceras sorbifolium]
MRLWYRKNSVFHGRLQLQVVDVVDWAGAFLDEFIDGSCVLKPPPVRVNSVVMWMAPSNNVFKINTNAAFNESANRWGVGVIIRDANGLVMAAYVVPRPDVCKTMLNLLANKAADGLAKAALLLCEEYVWVEEYAPCVESLVLDDSVVSL